MVTVLNSTTVFKNVDIQSLLVITELALALLSVPVYFSDITKLHDLRLWFIDFYIYAAVAKTEVRQTLQ